MKRWPKSLGTIRSKPQFPSAKHKALSEVWVLRDTQATTVFHFRTVLQHCWYIWPWRGPLPVCGLLSRWKNWTTQSLPQPTHSSRYDIHEHALEFVFTSSLKSSCHVCVHLLLLKMVISQHCNMMPFVDFRILSVRQTRASEFRGHRQAHTTSFRWLVWMWSSNPWKVVTGGNSKRTFPQAITFHVFWP